MTAPPVDRFDEMRWAWIAAHQGASTIQRRRAELLGRRIRARQRAVATAVPDPHDDSVIPPLWLRTAKSLASQLELFVVTVAALVVPLGWVGGRLLKAVVTQLISGGLRAFPIAALLWSRALLGLLILLVYDPAPDLGQVASQRGSAFSWPPYPSWPALRHRRGLARCTGITPMVAAQTA